MQITRNRKRLSVLAVAFALVFMVGAAFALTPGRLDVIGTVNLDAELYVAWYHVSPEPLDIAPLFITEGSSHNTLLEDANGRTNQIIVWNVYFVEPENGEFSATLTATARNNSAVEATISQVVAGWDDELLAEEWGLDINIFTGAITSVDLAGGAVSAEMSITVDWDGNFPASFDPLFDALPVFPLTVSLVYEPATMP